MKEDAFYEQLAELLEVDTIDPSAALDSYDNWDSLTVLALIAWLDKNAGVSLTAKAINQMASAGELFAQVAKLQAA
jgi:acyl carrier protein